MTLEERLENYVTTPVSMKTRKQKGYFMDGLTGPQRRRLRHKDTHQFVRGQEGETT
jgi:hypothetical protein